MKGTKTIINKKQICLSDKKIIDETKVFIDEAD